MTSDTDRDLLTPAEAAQEIARISGDDRPVSANTVGRWMTHGARIGGHRVVLESWLVGARRRRTTRAAISDWISACTAAAAQHDRSEQPNIQFGPRIGNLALVAQEAQK